MGGVITRDPGGGAAERHDLIVVGGGIYGVTLALEAARRGLRPLLLEREDFGARTSWNSLRILHGGLRYLQTLDLSRFRESVGERSWFLRHFPALVRPLPCLMPLYGRGLKRRPVLAAALRLDDRLSRDRNRGIERADRRIPPGRTLGNAETVELFPAVRLRGLRGAAAWYDATVPDSQRLLIELLRWACARGAAALNYVEAVDLLRAGEGVGGVAARDVESGARHEFRAPVVVNCAGPWVRDVARRFDRDAPELFAPSLAMNLLLDRDPPGSHAVAVAPPEPGGRVYFVVPWKGRTFAGTYHAPASAASEPDAATVRAFLAELERAIPGFGFSERDVLRVHWGLLPVRREGGVELTKRPVIRDHGSQGGPRGLFSVSGIKFTTARRVALATLRRIAASGALGRGIEEPAPNDGPLDPASPPGVAGFRELLARDRDAARRVLEGIVADEAVRRLDDLLLRRTDWGTLPRDGDELRPVVAGLLDRRVADGR